MTTNALTPREMEVAALVVRGLPNKRIAARLAVSVNTVEKHVENAAARLPNPHRLSARARIVAWMFARHDA
jgi:DNA-binding CsgD family transcriptional regulator